MLKIDLSGQRFGRLVVLEDAGRNELQQVLWLCSCDCGARAIVKSNNLRTGNTRSCGCVRGKPPIIHGHCLRSADRRGTPTYKTWCSMWQRCTNQNRRDYCYYGARGITVCKRWQSFKLFLADMGEKPPGLTIDRIDNDGNYTPKNCQWTTRSQQMKNRRIKSQCCGPAAGQ